MGCKEVAYSGDRLELDNLLSPLRRRGRREFVFFCFPLSPAKEQRDVNKGGKQKHTSLWDKEITICALTVYRNIAMLMSKGNNQNANNRSYIVHRRRWHMSYDHVA